MKSEHNYRVLKNCTNLDYVIIKTNLWILAMINICDANTNNIFDVVLKYGFDLGLFKYYIKTYYSMHSTEACDTPMKFYTHTIFFYRLSSLLQNCYTGINI